MTEYNGIVLIDKPAGFTSFDVVAKMRGIARTRKIGHAGTLDPMATGVLPLFFGRAAKACDILPRQDKCYEAEFRLGITTDTLDITGAVTSRSTVKCTKEKVFETATLFIGEVMQTPPMYSALKVDGRKLCDLARRGIEIERQARPVFIHSLKCEVVDESEQIYRMTAHCSKGTYIRTLAADIGERLGCGATLTSLRRTMAAGFDISDCIRIEHAKELSDSDKLNEAVIPIEKAFDSLSKVYLSEKQTVMALNGVRMDPSRIKGADQIVPFSVYSYSCVFLGIASIENDDFKMKKLFTLEV